MWEVEEESEVGEIGLERIDVEVGLEAEEEERWEEEE